MLPALHAAAGGLTLGAGVSRGRIDVAQQHFRDIEGVQFDLARADDDNTWSLVLDRSTWRHPGELAELDTRATTLLLQRHVAIGRGGLASADLGVIGVRERNLSGFAELASRGLLLQATLNGQWGAASWSFGGAWHRARFDASAFAGEPVRVDRAWIVDASVQWPLTPQHALRLELGGVVNRSTTVLFDNRYQQAGLLVQTAW
jgi:hypothetical protein